MFHPLKSIRTSERRETWAAFWTLFGFLAGHSLLETARDALFLESIPATRLPLLYLAIAAASLLVTQFVALSDSRLNRRRSLSAETAATSLITLAFWALLPALGPAGLYALYIWSGVMVTLVLIHFWTHLGDVFSITQAKRLYGFIGAGSVLGAIVGSALAGVLSTVVDARQLVLAAAVILGLTALVPMFMKPTAGGSGDRTHETHEQRGLIASADYIFRHVFTRRLLFLAIVTAAALTLADYLFKSIVAEQVDPAELGQFFAVCYLIFNVVSLIVQVALVGWFIRKLTLGSAIMVLPITVLIGGVGLAISASLVAAVLIKGADGSLRYSMDRTARELLLVPLGETARARIKSFTDVVGQRGGQAVASLGILLAVWLGLGNNALGLILAGLGAVWIVMAAMMREPYLDIFRRRLDEGQFDRRSLDQFPHLDLASIETLITALDSDNDDEVIAALDELENEEKSHLVPALILYHPSEAVVERALTLFTRARRKKVVGAADRLAKSGPEGVRAAAISARTAISPDAEFLKQFLEDESGAIRATTTVHLIDIGVLTGSDATEALDRFLESDDPQTCIAVANAISKSESGNFDSALIHLARRHDHEVQLAALRAMEAKLPTELLPTVLSLLAHEPTRQKAHSLLLKYGGDGLAALDVALADTSLPHTLRWQLPLAIAQFEPASAAAMLTDHLLKEPEGFIRFRIIRALEVIVQHHPKIPLDRDVLDRAIARNIALAYRQLNLRLTLCKGARDHPSRKTEGHLLLTKLLADKQEHALGRLFRLLGLASPGESYQRMYRGLSSKRPEVQAGSLELLDNVLPSTFRQPILGLVDDRPDDERQGSAGAFHQTRDLDYDAVLQELLNSESKAVQSMAVYHIGELRLESFRPQIEALEPDDSTQPDIDRTLGLLTAATNSSTSNGVTHAR